MSDIGELDISQELKKAEILKKQRELAGAPKKKKIVKKKKEKPKEIKTVPKNKFSKYNKFLPILYISIAIILAVFFRLHYATIPLMDDWAELSAIATFKPKIIEEVNTQFPYYSEEQKNQLIDDELDNALKEYDNLIDQKSESLKESFKDPDGHTYLYGIDSYYYYKKAKDRNLDNFLSFFSYYLHKIVSIFIKDATLMQTSFYISIIFVSLTIIPIYFITRRIINDMGGFIAATIFAIHPEFLKYSLAGIADTNTLNIFFIMMISWLFIELFYINSLRNRIIISIGMILLILIFSFTWSGYYIILGLIAVYSVIYLGLLLFNKLFHNFKKYQRIIFHVILLLFIIIGSFFGFNFAVKFMPEKVQNYMGFSSQDSIWPDSYSNITELKDVPFRNLILKSGGTFLFAILISSVLIILWKIIISEEIPKAYMYAILSAMIFLITSSKAIRIFPFGIPFICILFGFGMIFLQGITRKFIVLIDIKEVIIKVIVYLVVFGTILTLMSIPLSDNYSTFWENYSKVKPIKPRMDDSIYNTGLSIKENSLKDARIFTWWDKGHFFNAISDRDVILQGNPTMPRVYWMAKAIFTSDEKQSLGIIRMLGCNGESNAFKEINIKYSSSESINIIDKIVTMDKAGAKKIIQEKNLGQEIVRYTHCKPKESFIIVTDDMFTRFHTIQNYAYWDFEKAPDEQKNYNPFRAYECMRLNNTFSCIADKYRVTFDSETGETNVKTNEIIFVDDKIKKFSFNRSDSKKVMIIYKRDNKYYTIIIDKNIADSMYIRLMIEKGEGLENFELISDYSKPETIRVATYKVKW